MAPSPYSLPQMTYLSRLAEKFQKKKPEGYQADKNVIKKKYENGSTAHLTAADVFHIMTAPHFRQTELNENIQFTNT